MGDTNMICYDYIIEYIREITPKNTGVLKDMENFATDNNIPIIQPEVASFLKVLCNIIRPKNILEIGTAIGYSAILMSEFIQDGGCIDTIEIRENMVEIAKGNVKKSGLSHIINIIEGDGLEVIQNINKKYDMIFIDAAKGQYPSFFKYSFGLLKQGGVLVSDNILYKGMVANDELVIRRKKTIVTRLRKYISEISSHEKLQTTILPLGDGVAISYKK